MKNVCFFNSINFWGGGEKLHLEYAIEFKKKNYNVWLVAHKKSPLYQKANDAGINTFHTSASGLSFLNPIKLIRLFIFYKKYKIDTLIFSTSQDAKLASISGKLGGVKNIVYLRGLASVIKNSCINRLIFKRMITKIAVNSEATKEMVLKNLSKYINPNKIGVIYHGIEVGKLGSDDENKLAIIKNTGKGVTLGNAGRLTLQKGQLHLIEVARILKENSVEFTLFIAGTGELQQILLKRIQDYGLQNEVILLGFVAEMEEFMNSIDIFLLSSEWEGFGYVIVEALVKTKPVVAFNISSNPEIIQHGKTGFLVEFLDIKAFASKTQELIENKELQLTFGIEGRKQVIEKFEITDRITEFEYFILEKNAD